MTINPSSPSGSNPASAGGADPGAQPRKADKPFDLRVVLRLGKRYIKGSVLLLAAYIAGTLLVQTFIPIGVALNYTRITTFFHQTSESSIDTAPTRDDKADVGKKDDSEKKGESTPRMTGTGLVGSYFLWVGLTLVLVAGTFGTIYVQTLFDQKMSRAIRRDVFVKILQQSPLFFYENPPGELMVIVSQLTTSAALALRTLLVNPLLQVIGIIAAGRELYLQLVKMQTGHENQALMYFALITLFALLSPWLSSWMAKKLRRTAGEQQDQMLALGSLLEGVVKAPEEIQAMCSENAFDKKHTKLLDAALATGMRQTVNVGKLNIASQLPGNLVLIALVGLAVCLATTSHAALDPGTILALALLTPVLMGAVQGIGGTFINASMMWPGVAVVNDILESKESIVSSPEARDIGRIEPLLAVRDLVFSYRPGEQSNVLDGISFDLHPGKITGFVARPGEGKTTFFRLALRFYEPQKGELLLGGHPIRDFTLQSLRSHFALMSQFPVFFLDTVRENFLLAKGDATDAEIQALCQKTGLWSILEKRIGDSPLDRRYVPDRSLSGGQTKIFALTRSLLRNPTILLLDEPTTNIGPMEKYPLIPIMRKACIGKTVMVVDHDILWQKCFCDYFLVLSGGKIIQQGTAKDLLAMPGLFKELHDAALQSQTCEIGRDDAASSPSTPSGNK